MVLLFVQEHPINLVSRAVSHRIFAVAMLFDPSDLEKQKARRV